MLNLPAIKSAMANLGLTGSALAEKCEVSREAASNWLVGESTPRPSKLAKLAEVLGLSVDTLLEMENDTPEPVFAYRTKSNRAVSGASKLAAEELARHLQQVLPYVDPRSVFAPPQVVDPTLEEDHIRKVAESVRESLGLGPADPISNEQMISLFHSFGAFLVPVLWGLDKEQHENALSVYLPDSRASFVVFNLGCKQVDFKYWLAHEFGHCLSLHKLQGDDGEKYAETFAPCLVFPTAAARECLAAMQQVSTKALKLRVAQDYAERFGVSIVTVLKESDREAVTSQGVSTGLLDSGFWPVWNMNKGNLPSVAKALFGTDTPALEDYIAKSEAVYRTPIFKALTTFQRDEGGRNPAFIGNTLKVGLGDAIGLSYVLWKRPAELVTATEFH